MLPEEIELKLLRGKDIKIDKDIIIKQYTINQILDDIGLDVYNLSIQYIGCTPYDHRILLYDSGRLYTEISNWELFLSFVINKNKSIIDSMKLILDIDISKYKAYEVDNKIYLKNNENDNEIDETKFLIIQEIVREMCGMNIKIPSFANKTALIYEIEKYKRRLLKKRNLSNVTLKSLISSIAWNSYSIGINKIWDLTQYQLYDGLSSINKKDKWNNIMFGIYTGNIKQDSINLNKEQWFNK